MLPITVLIRRVPGGYAITYRLDLGRQIYRTSKGHRRDAGNHFPSYTRWHASLSSAYPTGTPVFKTGTPTYAPEILANETAGLFSRLRQGGYFRMVTHISILRAYYNRTARDLYMSWAVLFSISVTGDHAPAASSFSGGSLCCGSFCCRSLGSLLAA